ncbi:MAG TPA: Rieske (2Fe-2S) protein [Ornithinibacter sp.]|nr:Rieske (2Fe-2S) protein [Ornithinibacter sp.]
MTQRPQRTPSEPTEPTHSTPLRPRSVPTRRDPVGGAALLMDRRGMLAAAVVVGGAGALAACSSPPVVAESRSPSSPSSSAAAAPTTSSAPASSEPETPAPSGTPTSQIPVGGGKIFSDQQVVVTQPTAGQFKAFSAVCTHQGCIVGEISDGQIICPCHASHFDISSGEPTPDSLAQSPLPAKTVTVTGDTFTVG